MFPDLMWAPSPRRPFPSLHIHAGCHVASRSSGVDSPTTWSPDRTDNPSLESLQAPTEKNTGSFHTSLGEPGTRVGHRSWNQRSRRGLLPSPTSGQRAQKPQLQTKKRCKLAGEAGQAAPRPLPTPRGRAGPWSPTALLPGRRGPPSPAPGGGCATRGSAAGTCPRAPSWRRRWRGSSPAPHAGAAAPGPRGGTAREPGPGAAGRTAGAVCSRGCGSGMCERRRRRRAGAARPAWCGRRASSGGGGGRRGAAPTRPGRERALGGTRPRASPPTPPHTKTPLGGGSRDPQLERGRSGRRPRGRRRRRRRRDARPHPPAPLSRIARPSARADGEGQANAGKRGGDPGAPCWVSYSLAPQHHGACSPPGRTVRFG